MFYKNFYSEGLNLKTKMSRKQIRLGLYTISIIAVLGIFAYTGTTRANAYERRFSAQQQRSLSELGEYVDGIQIDLQKGVYSNTPPMLASLSSSLWRDAAGAKTCLSQLTLSDVTLEKTYKFLSQVGDFTKYLNRKVANDEEINEKERELLFELLKYATNLSKSISELRAGVDDGTISPQSIPSGPMKVAGQQSNATNMSSKFNDMEQTLVDFPTLIYDGPFSDHILKKESTMLKDKQGITKEEALTLAAKYCNVDPKSFTKTQEEDGNIKSYVFANKNTTVAIAKSGGLLCYILGSQWAGETTLSPDDGVARATEYLESIGYPNMTSSYHTVIDGICTINFAYKVDNVICYTDLIKVSVSLSDGKIISFDARGFLINHEDRSFEKPQLSVAQAQENLSHALTVQSVQLTNIPTDNGSEKYCYEFKCKGIKDDDVLVYINCTTGDEEQILMLIYGDGGTLTK